MVLSITAFSAQYGFPQELGVPYVVNEDTGMRIVNPACSSNISGLDIALGVYDTITSVYKFGRNEDVGSTKEPIWDGDTVYYWLPTASKVQIVSDDVDDTELGTGVRKLIIYGLDSNWEETSEVIIMDGTTPCRIHYRIC